MPYYGRPVGTELEPVGFGFNREVITGLLRGRYGFDGVVCTDWGLVTDLPMPDGSLWEAKAWGVEELDAADRLLRIVDAGCDQLGGEQLPELLVQLVEEGRISEARIDESARRILRDKFRLGLFDDPYVDPEAAEQTCGRPDFRAAGAEAQRRAMVLLANDGLLPLPRGARIYVDGLPDGSRGHLRHGRRAAGRRRRGDRLPQRALRAPRRDTSSSRSSTRAASTSRPPSATACSRSRRRFRRSSS